VASAEDLSPWSRLNLRANESPAGWLSLQPEPVRRQILSELTDQECQALEHDWTFWARRNQLPPAGKWVYWLLCAGRGFGKTRCGAEWTQQKAFDNPGTHGAIIAPTTDDAKKVMLSHEREHVEGASGILAIAPPWFRPRFEPSKRQLVWPNGTVATLYSAEEPGRLRGPQHHWGWVDEIAAWAGEADAWKMFLFGLRLGMAPQACVTTTPRPITILRDLFKNPSCVVTRGRTYDNIGNLSPVFIEEVIKPFEGTRLGRQELEGEMLLDVEGALWSLDLIDRNRVAKAPDMERIVIAIDPAGSHRKTSDETGMIVLGRGVDRHGYTIADISCRESPAAWGRRAVKAFWAANADAVVAEKNYGGEMVGEVIQAIDPNVPVILVHASKAGKYPRAEPVAAMMEQGRDHHVGTFPRLEDQMANYSPRNYTGSPDRMDAKVWGMVEMFFPKLEGTTITVYHRGQVSQM